MDEKISAEARVRGLLQTDLVMQLREKLERNQVGIDKAKRLLTQMEGNPIYERQRIELETAAITLEVENVRIEAKIENLSTGARESGLADLL